MGRRTKLLLGSIGFVLIAILFLSFARVEDFPVRDAFISNLQQNVRSNESLSASKEALQILAETKGSQAFMVKALSSVFDGNANLEGLQELE